MALKRPPQHRADAEPIFVHRSDEAWNDEARAIIDDPDSDENHPVRMYISGRTRFDLYAPLKYRDGIARAADWLDDKDALKFKIRRSMGVRKWSRVQSRVLATGTLDMETLVDACRYGLESCEGPGAPKLSGLDELTEKDLKALENLSDLGPALVWAIGDAAYWANIPLTDDEKKAFAS